MATNKTATQKVVTLEQFTKDLWEAQRKDLRNELGDAISAEDFERRFPAWEKLDEESRTLKVKTVNHETLRPLHLAGYEIRQKQSGTSGAGRPQ